MTDLTSNSPEQLGFDFTDPSIPQEEDNPFVEVLTGVHGWDVQKVMLASEPKDALVTGWLMRQDGTGDRINAEDQLYNAVRRAGRNGAPGATDGERLAAISSDANRRLQKLIAKDGHTLAGLVQYRQDDESSALLGTSDAAEISADVQAGGRFAHGFDVLMAAVDSSKLTPEDKDAIVTDSLAAITEKDPKKLGHVVEAMDTVVGIRYKWFQDRHKEIGKATAELRSRVGI